MWRSYLCVVHCGDIFLKAFFDLKRTHKLIVYIKRILLIQKKLIKRDMTGPLNKLIAQKSAKSKFILLEKNAQRKPLAS